ncbi:hypothetical protein TWF506_006361 [Arthrobotrys conoides]|uniref:Uncharacterized protein n=1 Tax=Arthrobotrys conoides TaxID=74498 RepID=A0AAN8NLY1_9PEZI
MSAINLKLPVFTAQNQDYILTPRVRQSPPTIENLRIAARIIGRTQKHHVRWRASFEDVARQYMTLALLASPGKKRGYISAAVRAFQESEIGSLTARFIEAFQITGGSLPTASEVSLDKTWRILSDPTALVVLHQQIKFRL